jgi:hypothetical protein
MAKLPERTPSVMKTLTEPLLPLLVMIIFLVRGLLPTLRYMLFHPLSIPFPSAWRKSIHKVSCPYLLAQADIMLAKFKQELVSQAKGHILEIGAGTGATIKYYDKSKIDVVYGVEPNLDALSELRKEVVKYDMEEKYEILPFGVEDEKRMSDAGVTPGSIDTVVCVYILRLYSFAGINDFVDTLFMFNTDA